MPSWRPASSGLRHVPDMLFTYLQPGLRSQATSLGDTDNCANSVGFWVSVPLLPPLCPLSVLEVGVCGVYLECP